jgi:uncharacterized protein (TIGR03067 family)
VLLVLAPAGTVAGLLYWRGAGGEQAAERVGEDLVVGRPPVGYPIAGWLEGTWRLDAMTKDGQTVRLSDDPAQRPRIGFTDDGKVTGGDMAGRYRIDIRKRPMQMDWTFDGKTTLGIFDLRGDTLTVSLAMLPSGQPAAMRPKGLEPGPGSWVMEYFREKP